jgi:hypothetical protein
MTVEYTAALVECQCQKTTGLRGVEGSSARRPGRGSAGCLRPAARRLRPPVRAPPDNEINQPSGEQAGGDGWGVRAFARFFHLTLKLAGCTIPSDISEVGV